MVCRCVVCLCLCVRNCICEFSFTRSKAAVYTDKRVKVMNEVITGIRVIKMYAWEYAFRDLVSSIRK